MYSPRIYIKKIFSDNDFIVEIKIYSLQKIQNLEFLFIKIFSQNAFFSL